MTAKDNGNSSAHPLTNDWATFGLTKRELFAAMAMQGWLASFADDAEISPKGEIQIAELAVRLSDALLSEMAKEKTE